MSGIRQAESNTRGHPDIGDAAQPDIEYQDAIYLVYGTRAEAPTTKDNKAWEKSLRELAKGVGAAQGARCGQGDQR